MDKAKHYNAIDGLKAVSIMMIVLMHVFKNGNFNLDGYFFDVIIKHLSIFVEMFFILSAFGMCCGYYEKIKNNTISIKDFYLKRYKKILPFFSIIVILDLCVSGINIKNIFEGVLNLSLTTGLLPKYTTEIVGISWALGVIFAFYILFPFFVFLMWNKKSAWCTLAFIVLLKIIGSQTDKNIVAKATNNITAWALFFVIGGIVFLYKDDLIKFFKNKKVLLVALIVIVLVAENLVYIKFKMNVGVTILIILSFVLLLVYALVETINILGSKPLTFVGRYCLEIFLSHMLIFRVIEKIGLVSLIKQPIASFIIVFLLTMVFSLLFSIVIHKAIDFVFDKCCERKK